MAVGTAGRQGGPWDEIFADKYLSHSSGTPAEERGPKDVKKFVSIVNEWRSAFTDTENMIGEGDKLVDPLAPARDPPRRV